jgi:predicted MPP superfamily phosphohydrolase
MRNGDALLGARVERIRLTVPSLPPGRPPLSICHLSDLHLRRLTSRHERLAELVAERDPDLVLLTGDVLVRGDESPRATAKLLPRLRGRCGTFACPGNGELRRLMRPTALKSMMADRGVDLLVNESRVIDTPAGRLLVAGVDDLSLGWPDTRAALARRAPVDCAILLSHAPLAARMAPDGASVNLVLSGHTHGGQIRIPLLWRLLLPTCHGGFAAGLYETPWGHVYVNRGFGTGPLLPLRFRCPAEVAFIELSGPAGDADGGLRPSGPSASGPRG